MYDTYDYALGLTSQLSHCSLPLRLDSYSKCSFRCAYCFAKNRGGNHPPDGMKMINPKSLENILSQLNNEQKGKNVISQLLQRRVPIHFGGMSDPFMPYEILQERTFKTMSLLSRFHYPTIISTKGILLSEPKYVNLLAEGSFALQISFCTLDDFLSKKIETNTPAPSKRIELIRSLSSICWVSARLQPMIPGNLDAASEAIVTLAKAGVKHISVEFLKIPFFGGQNLLNSLSHHLNTDISKYYSDRRINALEFLVNKDYAVNSHSQLITIAKLHNISYSSADTDLLPFDASDSCCSGTAEVKGFENYYKYTFPQAIRNALSNKSDFLTFEHLDNEWAPEGSIKRYLNSKTRIEGENTIKRFMATKWNNASSAYGPLSFHGIYDTGTYDNNQMKIFKISSDAIKLATVLEFDRFRQK